MFCLFYLSSANTPKFCPPPTPLGILVLLETTLMHELSLLEILDCVFVLELYRDPGKKEWDRRNWWDMLEVWSEG